MYIYMYVKDFILSITSCSIFIVNFEISSFSSLMDFSVIDEGDWLAEVDKDIEVLAVEIVVIEIVAGTVAVKLAVELVAAIVVVVTVETALIAAVAAVVVIVVMAGAEIVVMAGAEIFSVEVGEIVEEVEVIGGRS